MAKLFNRVSGKRLRQELRNTATDAERLLWQRLKGKQLFGLKFRRQYGVGKYVVDFYCPAEQIVVEVDGDVHYMEAGRQKDARRDAYLRSVGLRVLRFTNLEIRTNISGVLEVILREAGKSSLTTP